MNNGLTSWKNIGIFVAGVLVLGAFPKTRTLALWVAVLGIAIVLFAKVKKG